MAATLLDKPKASIDEIIQIITGPDFPTGGTIDGRIGIYEAIKLVEELFMSALKHL